MANVHLTRSNFVSQLIERNTELNKIVYQSNSYSMTYDELFRFVGSFANTMQELKVLPAQRVIIALNDSPAFSIVMLASLWIGAVPVPINPTLKVESLEHIFKDSNPVLAVVEPENKINFDRLGGGNSKAKLMVQDMYVFGQSVPTYADGALLLSAALANIVKEGDFFVGTREMDYLQYTSGTTGAAKGVKHMCEGMIANSELYAKNVLGISNLSRIYSTAKMFFGYGLGNSLFFNLWHQSTAWLDHRWPTKIHIIEGLEVFRPTHFFSVPNIYSMLIHDAEMIARQNPAPTLVSAGSTLPGAVFNKWKLGYELEIIDGIGATEVGHIYLSGKRGECKPGFTGKVVPGYEAKLVAEVMDNPSSNKNKIGTLWINGPSVSSGYYNDPIKTQEKFVDSWYNSGDVFEEVEPGRYSYLGRSDDLFKIKGRWIAPIEVENFLISLFPVFEGFLYLAIENDEGIDEPCVVIGGCNYNDSSKRTLIKEVLSYIGEQYPNYYLPQNIYFMSNLPRNDNGKIMRRIAISQIKSGNYLDSFHKEKVAAADSV